ncbi:unnamed protein product [Owenia fusiformis]|uniref:Uncharacterized protein n=1 Tax=Owenia fusiformis TaxID=6347 RepID=A0A8J1XTR1_OWEFU|nr:unnamed protein product [Owenia fusiformis]
MRIWYLTTKLTILDAVNATELSEFCETKCNGLNGGYFAFEGDCCRFIVCQLTQSRFGPGQYIGYNQTCMYPLVWDDEIGACNDAKNVEGCTEDCHTPPEPTPFVTQYVVKNASRMLLKQPCI